MTFEEKTSVNCRMQRRYDELMRIGKHGHYETMFRVMHEEIAREREACAKVCEDHNTGDMSFWALATEACAEAIRARSQETKP
jgi:hypothetical protein